MSPTAPPTQELPSRPRIASSRALPVVGRLTDIAIALLLGAVLAGGWLAGWRAEILTTASMGTAAPVGTLVLSRPLGAGSVRVGDLVVFHPPGQPHTTFVHRVVGVRLSGPDRLLETRGDLSGAVDPWTLPARSIIGRAVVRLPAVGWLLRMLPWLVAGTVSVLIFTMGMGVEARRAIRILGLTFVAVVAVWHFRPLVGMELISSGATRHGDQVTVVSTGVLPTRVHALKVASDSAVLNSGQAGTVRTTAPAPNGRLLLIAAPHLSGWWWWLLATWAFPLFAGLGQRRQEQPTADSDV